MTNDYRIEKDLIGEMEIPADVLYGIHAARAAENFPITGRAVNAGLVSAYGMVKLAALKSNHKLGFIDDAKFSAISQACEEMIEGKLDESVIVDPLQGGAGTSLNMNVNEVLANRALQILGKPLGSYDIIHPIEDVNLHQSTNDTYPTAVKVAAMKSLGDLEVAVVKLVEAFQIKESQFADVIKVARTQLQDAVLTTLGRQFSCYSEAFSRDRWRIYKCNERLRVVNLGGTAIGTGLDASRKYIFDVVGQLKDISGLPISRAENLVEATQNTDVFVEVSGILKALASSLLKIATDLRLLSSGPDAGFGEIKLPARQAGSSIMPGKVNPVIPEAVSQVAIQVFANDSAITQSCSMGNLHLNQFMPLIADCLLNNISILTNACDIFEKFCVRDIVADKEKCSAMAHSSTAIVTALVEQIGYEKAQDVAKLAIDGKAVRDVVIEKGFMSSEQFDETMSAENITKLGFSGNAENA